MSNLLIVDDMAVFREPIAASLRHLGFETTCAMDGQEALRSIQDRRPDLILLDIAMPVMDGLACLRAIRERSDTKDIPVIMLTALGEREPLAKAVQIGVQGYLLKSQFSLEDLVERVRKALAESEPATPKAPVKDQPTASPGDASETKQAPIPDDQVRPIEKEEVLRRLREETHFRAVPTVLQHVMALTRNNRTSFEEVANAVRRDHALALKVMRVANSSFFGAGTNVQTLAEAGQRIGMAGIRNSIATILTIEHFDSASVGGLTPQRFWEHSLGTGALADLIGRRLDFEDVESLFLSGLLHDVGRLVLATIFPDHYRQVLKSSAERDLGLVTVEREMFGLSHDTVTEELLRQWRTPDEIRAAAQAHELTVGQMKETMKSPQGALIVALANCVAHASLVGDSGDSTLRPFSELATALGLKGDAIHAVAREASDKTLDLEMFYATRTEQKFRHPLSDDLAAKVGGEVKLTVFAAHKPGDPVSLFCEQLGWLEPAKPRMAVLSVHSELELGRRLRELYKLESSLGTKLDVLVVSQGAAVAPPPNLLDGRSCATAAIPGSYARFVEAVADLARTPAPEAVGA